MSPVQRFQVAAFEVGLSVRFFREAPTPARLDAVVRDANALAVATRRACHVPVGYHPATRERLTYWFNAALDALRPLLPQEIPAHV